MVCKLRICFFDHKFCLGIRIRMMFSIKGFNRIGIAKYHYFHEQFSISFIVAQKSSNQKKIDALLLIEFIWTYFSIRIICLRDKIWVPRIFWIRNVAIISVFHICSEKHFICRKFVGALICWNARSGFFIASIQNLEGSSSG